MQHINQSEEKSKYSGKIFEIIQKKVLCGNKEKIFEIARRSPGVRILVIKNEKILLTKEFRYELDNFDFRLPGGKVFDTLEAYKKHETEDILPFAREAAQKELLEETGLIANNIEFLSISKLGATIEWDLYYFLVTDFKENKSGQNLEDGENISVEWKSFEEVRKLIHAGKFSEDRNIGVLLNFL